MIVASQWELTWHNFEEFFYLYSYEEKYIPSVISSDKIKGRHSTKRIIDDLCTKWWWRAWKVCLWNISNLSTSSCISKYIQDDHATFLNLDITSEKVFGIYKIFDKGVSFFFSTARMTHIESNISRSIFLCSNPRWAIKTCLLNSMPQGLYE